MNDDEQVRHLEDIARLEGQLVAAKTRLYSRAQGGRDQDVKRLQCWSWILWSILLATILASAVWVTVMLRVWSNTVPLIQFSLAAAAGVLGATLSGLMSLNDRVANGWEFEGGAREPDPAEKRERFNLRMTRGFLARPFLGLASGPLVLAGLKLAQIVPTGQAKSPDILQYKIVFYCLLGGFLSKTLFDWLKDSFKKILEK